MSIAMPLDLNFGTRQQKKRSSRVALRIFNTLLANSDQASLHSQPKRLNASVCVSLRMFPWSGLIIHNILFRRTGARAIQAKGGWAASAHNQQSTRRAKSWLRSIKNLDSARLLFYYWNPFCRAHIMDKKTNSAAAKYAQTHTQPSFSLLYAARIKAHMHHVCVLLWLFDVYFQSFVVRRTKGGTMSGDLHFTACARRRCKCSNFVLLFLFQVRDWKNRSENRSPWRSL